MQQVFLFLHQRVAELLGSEFTQELSSVTEDLMKSMDAQIVVDDVLVGRKFLHFCPHCREMFFIIITPCSHACQELVNNDNLL